MAKITFGPIVSEARNKVGGVVYSRNTHGPYTREFIVPPYSNTTAQAAARAAMAALSQRWGSTLTDEQRAGWRALGELYPHTDVFHQVNSRPGLQTYLRANLALSSVGISALDTAPRNWNATDPGMITATTDAGSPPAISVNATTPPAANEAVQIWVTPQQSPGANYFHRRLRLVATAPAGTAGAWDPSAGWAARFGALAFPAKLGIGIRYVNVETGATGPMRTALIAATAAPEEFMVRTTTLSPADIAALDTTPVILVPAPGPGFAIIPLSITAQLLPNTTPFTGAGHVHFSLGPYANGNEPCNQLPPAVVPESYNPPEIAILACTINQENNITQFDNQPLITQLDTGDPPFVGGDSSLRVTVIYQLIPV